MIFIDIQAQFNNFIFFTLMRLFHLSFLNFLFINSMSRKIVKSINVSKYDKAA